ncbi:MAG: GNAT family N-acetyltransferase [Chloroflexota bacterium]|nr:GNAT family N-acetyltransferase [Chloroflexota bacterium]
MAEAIGGGVPRDSITIQPFTRRDRQSVRDLIFRSSRVHVHLDWQEIDDWLLSPDGIVQIAWLGRRLVGVIGVSKPVDGACWLRLLVVSDFGDGAGVIDALWSHLRATLPLRDQRTVAVLVSREWVMNPLAVHDFHPAEEIVTLERPRLPITAPPPPADLTLRLIRPDEIDAITAIDHQAFASPWQMERADLRQAEKASSIGLVALVEGQIVGYALCTVFVEGAHLARLGVFPAMQRRGIAGALLADALWRFQRRSIYTMTVNTQASNARSLRLYARFGFARNGYDIPVWMFHAPTIQLVDRPSTEG